MGGGLEFADNGAERFFCIEEEQMNPFRKANGILTGNGCGELLAGNTSDLESDEICSGEC